MQMCRAYFLIFGIQARTIKKLDYILAPCVIHKEFSFCIRKLEDFCVHNKVKSLRLYTSKTCDIGGFRTVFRISLTRLQLKNKKTFLDTPKNK